MDWRNNVLAPVITAVTVSAVFYSSDILLKAPSYVIPSGTVAAFNLSKCPNGWKDFEEAKGRVIIGVGNGSELSERLLGQRGGSETHTLTIQELPKHDHHTWGQNKIFGSSRFRGVTTRYGFLYPPTKMPGLLAFY